MKKLLFLSLALATVTSAALSHQTNTETVFAVIGDFGKNSCGEFRTAKALKLTNPQFVITVGDNNYQFGCWKDIDKNIGKYYHQYIGNYQGKYGKGAAVNQFFPTLGNHDWAAKDKCLHYGSLPYFSYFTTLPGNQRYYDFRRGAVNFFAIDADAREPDGVSSNSKQYHWFAKQVAKSDAPFKIAYFHMPPYSSGKHGSNAEMQWDFAKLGVDVVIAGHDHDYERIERDGIYYFVNGAGGAKLYTKGTTVAGSKFFYNKHHGFMLVHADSSKMRLQFINDRRDVIDEVVIPVKTKALTRR